METGVRGYAEELVAVLDAARSVLADLPGGVHRLTGAELEAVLPVLDRLAAAAGAGRFTVTAEAVARGEVAASQAGSVAQWVAARCPSLDARDAGLLAKAVRELAEPGVPGLTGPGLTEPARAAVVQGRLSVPAACVVVSELRQLTPLVAPDAMPAVAAGLVAMGQVDGAVGVRRVRPELLARYGLGAVLQGLEDRHAGLTVLSCGHDLGGGITEYRLRLDPQARAVVEAAVNAASAPRPVHGDPDPRTIDQRRGDALVAVCRRALSTINTISTGSLTAAGDAGPGGAPGRAVPDRAVPGGTGDGEGGGIGCGMGGGTGDRADPGSVRPGGVKATVVVTIGLADLQARTRPGVVIGGLDGGSLLGPETVRKLACDGAVIPAVLDTHGHILRWGRTRRLFSPPQVQALWLRDRHCTFPGCPTPASWCDAHHLRHWLDGGPTDLDNAALLCQRHHTIVHRDRLTGTLHPTNDGPHITWDRAPGSYDRGLDRDMEPAPFPRQSAGPGP